MATILFVGLGNMGGPMAANLVKAGHRVLGQDLVPANLERAAAAGVETEDIPEGKLGGIDAIVTMLPSGSAVGGVYGGPSGLIARAAPGTLLIDCSTIDVATARLVAQQAADAGLLMVDAPVSGGVGGAEAGTLTFMVGGPEGALAAATPYLEAMGKTIVHAGDAGTGQAAKICNNMVLGISMIAVSEAFALADRLGLDRQRLFDIASKASGQCWSLTTYCPVPGPVPTSPANREYRPGFAAAMMLKDLDLAHDAAAEVGADTALGEAARDRYRAFCEAGHDGMDFSGIFRMIGKDL